MVVAPYLIGRNLGIPKVLTVSSVLPEMDDSLTCTYRITPFAEGSKFGQCLCISYEDVESGAELLDIVLPDMPQDVLSLLLEGTPLSITDSKNGVSVQVELSKQEAIA